MMYSPLATSAHKTKLQEAFSITDLHLKPFGRFFQCCVFSCISKDPFLFFASTYQYRNALKALFRQFHTVALPCFYFAAGQSTGYTM